MKQFHLIGIKGAGMSALAQVLHNMGHFVQGSDKSTEFFTQRPLEELGIPLLSFEADNIQPGFTVIASNAYAEDHVEVEAAQRQGLSFFRYHEFLGNLIESFSSIAVTGAHGKTSTTGLMSHIISGIAPTSFIVGDGTGKGIHPCKYFIFEGCEYRRHFLSYKPDYAVITNIDFDHPDYFSGIEDVRDAFQELTHQVKKQIIAYGDDPNIRALITQTPMLTYGFNDSNDLIVTSKRNDAYGTHFVVEYRRKSLGEFFIPLFGDHAVLNSLAVIGICLLEGLDLALVRNRFETFQGVRRRFSEKKWLTNILIDDYAHHPTEVRATLQAAHSKYPNKKLIAIFQPHTYSRLYHFIDGFAEALEQADEVYLCDIFGSARESAGKVSIEDLLNRVENATYLHQSNIDTLLEYEDSVLLFMGAGDIQKYQKWFMEETKKQQIQS